MRSRSVQFLCLLAILASSLAHAQALEQLDLSSTSSNYNTYVTGINNAGYVTGYYTPPAGSNVGFIITPTGKKLLINPSFLGATDTKVESINNHGVAVVSAVGGSSPLYKAYVDTLGDSISSIVAITNVQQPNAQPLDINDLNDMSGWYQGAQRWLYVQHDSIVPGTNSAWEAKRYQTAGPVYYNTFGTGINNANKVAGFWIDGSVYTSFAYDNILHTFDTFASTSKVKVWDINNNNIVCGEYQQTNGYWMAFTANVSNGSYTQFNSLDDIFDGDTIQSVANGVNDNGEVAGSFLHPVTGKWTGFIYHPNDPEFNMPGFNFMQHTWSMKNSNTGTNPLWTSNYWGGFNYDQIDPYSGDANPIDAYMNQTYGFFLPVRDSLCVSWPGLASEIDVAGIGTSTDPADQQAYLNIYRDNFMSKYAGFGTNYSFAGYCYGFSYTTLMHLYEEAIFSGNTGLPMGYSTYPAQNTDVVAIKALERAFIKQSDVATYNKYGFPHYADISMWGGLYRLKNTYRKSFADTDPAAVAISFTTGGYHSILPYRIKTPSTLPFNYMGIKYDTLFIYDSNYPSDMNQFFTVNSYQFNAPHDSVYNTSYPNLDKISFNKPGVRFVSTVLNAQLKSTSGVNYDGYVNFTLLKDGHYTINATNSQASLDGSGYTYNNNTSDFIPVTPEYNVPTTTYTHSMDTTKSVDITTTNYTANLMSWLQTNRSRTMNINRQAQLTETDHSTQKNRMITYGNPDNVTKYLNAQMTEITEDLSQGTNIKLSNICAAQGDSIVTESPSAFVYKVTKVAGTMSCTYDITSFTLYNGDSIIEYHGNVLLDPNSSHTIDPYFNGGTELVILVDDGNDGTTDDTVFVAGWPLGVKEQIIHKNGIKIYPNPVQDELSVEFPDAGNYSIAITDVVGRTVYSKTAVVTGGKIQIPMGQHPVGLYLIQVSDSKGATLLKDKIIKH
jgi:hypothetical protein